ncbi:MAG: NADH-quinone oxidoreductase subunit A, partial [Candidatus Omnitrophica bacterium]|nr:NADH-quinone oxidoreductase subunit A [Candidatus Omnitrophota bacterium]
LGHPARALEPLRHATLAARCAEHPESERVRELDAARGRLEAELSRGEGKARRDRGERASDPYESGEVPIGGAWVQFDINYYLFALIFLAFDVEAALLFPVLVVYRELASPAALFEIALFLALLTFAILYAWKKGLFSWK